jgi:polyphosphate kinase
VEREPDEGAAHDARYFIGSADLLQRNLDFRIEALVPVTDSDLCAQLEDVLSLDLADDRFSWTLDGEGRWSKVPTVRGISVQERLAEMATERFRQQRPHETAL